MPLTVPPRNGLDDILRLHNLKASSSDPSNLTGSFLFVSGTIYVIKLYLPDAVPITNVELYLPAYGATLTSAQNLCRLYNSAGVGLGSTADQSTNWLAASGTRSKHIALTGGPFVAGGGANPYVFVGILSNGTTPISLMREGTTAEFLNFNLAAADGFRYGTHGTSQTALPTDLTLSGMATLANSIWAGLT